MKKFILSAALLLPLALAITTQPAKAQIYRTTDAQGNVIFTDTPPADAGPTEKVKLQTTNTTPPPPDRPAAAAATSSPAEANIVTYSVSITSPDDETSFPMGPGNFSVSVEVKPALEDTQNLQLFLDDIPWGDPQRETTWELTNVFRGEHNLTVGIIDDQGEPLESSDPVRVFVHRPSISFRNR